MKMNKGVLVLILILVTGLSINSGILIGRYNGNYTMFTYSPEDLVELISIDKEGNNVLEQHSSFIVDGQLNINNEIFTEFLGCTLNIRDKERLLSNFNVTKANTVVTIISNYNKQGEYLGQEIDTLKLPVSKESIQIKFK